VSPSYNLAKSKNDDYGSAWQSTDSGDARKRHGRMCRISRYAGNKIPGGVQSSRIRLHWVASTG